MGIENLIHDYDCLEEMFLDDSEMLDPSNPFANCNNVVTQGMIVKEGKPVMIKKFTETVHFWKHHAQFMFSWEPMHQDYCCVADHCRVF
mmetsp:Transcript_641/g.1314  ORF Transcript_641/g.1314 Transcript_641/m.1314 type:complete len:89 (+) Transcript_641:397-663(+)